MELSANEANVVLLERKASLFSIVECRARKIILAKDHAQGGMQHFQKTFAKLLEDYQVKRVAIKERPSKGKFAGGALSFKMEAAIQLIPGVEVSVIAPAEQKAAIKDRPPIIDFADTELKGFQEPAFWTAYAATLVNDTHHDV